MSRTSWKGLAVVGLMVAVTLLAAPAFAGVVIKFESRDLTDASQNQTGTMQIEGRKLRVDDLSGEEGEDMSMLFDGSTKVLVYVDHNKKTYFELSAEKMKTMMAGVSDQMQTAMKQLEQQMANMPPEQRKQMEEMMKQQGMGGMMGGDGEPPPPIELRKTSESKTLNGKNCRRYDLYRADEKETEAWVADWGSVGLDEGVFKVFEDLGEMFDEMMESVPMSMAEENPFEGFGKLPGFPFLTRDFEDGQAAMETQVLEFNKETVDASTFQPPAGYEMVDPFQR